MNTVPQMKFGIAFNEASGACLTRIDGNDEDLKVAGGPERIRRRCRPHIRDRDARAASRLTS